MKPLPKLEGGNERLANVLGGIAIGVALLTALALALTSLFAAAEISPEPDRYKLLQINIFAENELTNFVIVLFGIAANIITEEMATGFIGKQAGHQAQGVAQKFTQAKHQANRSRAEAKQVEVLAVCTSGALVDDVAQHADDAENDNDKDGWREAAGAWFLHGYGSFFGPGGCRVP